VNENNSRKNELDDSMFWEKLNAQIFEANKGIAHTEFVTGILNKKLGFKVMKGEPSALLKGYRKIIFNIIVMLYSFAPLLFIPLWAYIESNWWLLIGIIISFIATRFSAKLIYNEKRQNSIGGFLFIACIVLWIYLGIHNYYTFFTLSALWGFMFFQIADNVEKEYAIQMLIENSEIFDKAIAQNKIMIFDRTDKNI